MITEKTQLFAINKNKSVGIKSFIDGNPITIKNIIFKLYL